MTTLVRGRRAVAVLAAAALALGAAGCGATGAPASAPVITVVTGNSALALVTAEVGGAHVHVVDVVPDGDNPRTAPLGAAALAQVRAAVVAVVVGGGYQPALERAASAAGGVVDIAATPAAAAAGPWLDPGTVSRWVPTLAAALSAADPGAHATFANGATDVVAEMTSLSADYQNSLSDCPRKVIVTPDAEWRGMSDAYGLVDRVIGTAPAPPPSAVAAAAAEVRAAGAKTVFSEPWVPDATVEAAAAATGTKVRALDTLDGTPAGGWPAGATYDRLMEQDLAQLTSALQCAAMGQN